MPLPDQLTDHPTPAQVMAIATSYSDLLKSLFLHPQFKYAQPPTAEFVKPAPDTHAGLYFIADFVQNTYMEHVLPLLPPGATRKCDKIGNPWARDDASYNWTWTWDEAEGVLRDETGSAVAFPTLSAEQLKENLGDLVGRGMMAKKIVLENETNAKARLLMGGEGFEFGEEAKAAVRKIV
jgi:hypothetical protein